MNAAAAKWQAFAQQGGPTGQPAGNVRQDEAYARKCAEGMKLPPPGAAVTEEHRVEYPALRDEEIRALGQMIFDKSEALWIKDTPQTMVRGFLHDMLTKGEPASQAPLIRGGEHAEWLEAEIAKAYRRGHYRRGRPHHHSCCSRDRGASAPLAGASGAAGLAPEGAEEPPASVVSCLGARPTARDART